MESQKSNFYTPVINESKEIISFNCAYCNSINQYIQAPFENGISIPTETEPGECPTFHMVNEKPTNSLKYFSQGKNGMVSTGSTQTNENSRKQISR